MGCCQGMCTHCHAIYKIVFAALLLLNALIWPLWNGIDGWIQWLAVLMIVGGVLKLVVPNKCPKCNAMQESGMGGMKSKKR